MHKMFYCILFWEISENIDCPQSQGRFISYYGNVSYSYASTTHPAQPYPDCPVIQQLFTGLQTINPDITPESYTCHVTLYPSGDAGIPLHHDADQLHPGSMIYAVSIGATRTLILQNQSGPINEICVPLPHGSVYSMSGESQGLWKHAINAVN